MPYAFHLAKNSAQYHHATFLNIVHASIKFKNFQFGKLG
jgi:hypothetical protein